MDVDRTSMQLENQNKEELRLKDRARCVCVCVCVCVRERGQGKQTAETRREETLRYKANTDRQKAQRSYEARWGKVSGDRGKNEMGTAPNGESQGQKWENLGTEVETGE